MDVAGRPWNLVPSCCGSVLRELLCRLRDVHLEEGLRSTMMFIHKILNDASRSSRRRLAALCVCFFVLLLPSNCLLCFGFMSFAVASFLVLARLVLPLASLVLLPGLVVVSEPRH
jgi:hypothetical protein